MPRDGAIVFGDLTGNASTRTMNRRYTAAAPMSAFRGKADIQLKPHNVCCAVDDCTCPSTGAELVSPLPLSSLIVVVAVVAMMMTSNSGDEGNKRRRGNHGSS